MSAYRSILIGLVAMSAGGATSLAGGGGSLLIYPNIELKWDNDGNLTTDTIVTLTNSYPLNVLVKVMMVNGDEPTAPVFDAGGNLIERGHPGWNKLSCEFRLIGGQTVFWSNLTGLPNGCPFGLLDGGDPPGRPDPDSPFSRTLRGFMYVWAIGTDGGEINWEGSLSGNARIFDYASGASWSYSAEGFRALAGDRHDPLPEPGVLRLDGVEYEAPPSVLQFSFFPSGVTPQTNGFAILRDTDLTLLPVSQDFRQDNDGPPKTKARFSISNLSGSTFSGTEECITCWEQRLLTQFRTPNHFVRTALGSDIGTATVDGVTSFLCGPGTQALALLGVAVEMVAFTQADSNMNAVVDVADFRVFRGCLNNSGPGEPLPSDMCRDLFDLDGDGDTDLRDAADFPYAEEHPRSYSTILLVGMGSQNAIIRYDVSN